MQVTVRGDGIAARCCARLLEGAGLGVSMDFSERAKIPAIMIGATTQGLFADAFGRPDLFEDARPIAKRIVAWGADAPPRTIPHAAVVASESGLLARLPRPPFPRRTAPRTGASSHRTRRQRARSTASATGPRRPSKSA